MSAALAGHDGVWDGASDTEPKSRLSAGGWTVEDKECLTLRHKAKKEAWEDEACDMACDQRGSGCSEKESAGQTEMKEREICLILNKILKDD